MSAAPTSPTIELGPTSLLGRLAADPRVTFTGFSAGVLQLMHPAVSAGVLDHSAFFSDPFDRIYRSFPRIMRSITEPDSKARCRAVRDYHKPIKGTDAHGERYSALDPDVYWWTHATFVWAFLRAADLFHHAPPRGAERERYYAESLEWWRRYGLSMRPVAPDLTTFEREFERTCREDLEWTRAADLSLRLRRIVVPNVPRGVSDLLSRPGTPLVRLMMVGGLPATVRERFPIAWSRADAASYRALVLGLRNAGRLYPDTVAQRHGLALAARLESTTRLTSETTDARY